MLYIMEISFYANYSRASLEPRTRTPRLLFLAVGSPLFFPLRAAIQDRDILKDPISKGIYKQYR